MCNLIADTLYYFRGHKKQHLAQLPVGGALGKRLAVLAGLVVVAVEEGLAAYGRVQPLDLRQMQLGGSSKRRAVGEQLAGQVPLRRIGAGKSLVEPGAGLLQELSVLGADLAEKCLMGRSFNKEGLYYFVVDGLNFYFIIF